MYVILLGLAGFLVFEMVQVWNRPLASGAREAPQGVKESAPARPAAEAPAMPPQGQEAGLQPREAYQVVAVKNPFRPSRTDWEGAGRQVDRPKVFLYGVTLAGEYQSALIAIAPAGKGRGARLYRVGDQVGGYTLKEIKADQVSLALGEDVFTVRLYDAAKPKPVAPAPPVAAGAPTPLPVPSPQPTVRPTGPVTPSPVDKRREGQLERFRRLQTEPGSNKNP
ncbi:MAG: hypothetical protein HZA23_00500 [Nitrospirae bacterium]|nr:hypothetical protein [Nitrospirota bacterium]